MSRKNLGICSKNYTLFQLQNLSEMKIDCAIAKTRPIRHAGQTH